jgi:hypothetical protein
MLYVADAGTHQIHRLRLHDFSAAGVAGAIGSGRAELTSPQHRHGDGRRSHVRRPGVLSLIPSVWRRESEPQRAQRDEKNAQSYGTSYLYMY